MKKDIIDVKMYYEYARVSGKNLPFKIGVLKVKYTDGSWEIIFRKIIGYKFLNLNGVEQYKSIEFNQLKQLSNIIKNESTIFRLYLKKYLKELNINTMKSKSNIRIYVETNVLSKLKSAFNHFNPTYENVTNI